MKTESPHRCAEFEAENIRLRAALNEVVQVLTTNTWAIVDTVWVSDGSPETLLDRCCDALLAKP